ncbi:RecQ family ATP-dependent DNA helicase [Lentilactobacillus kisonensis]|uniref:ATP-dependent DNA helicase RecQ n=1 Tax=Lentilactobacillus kisonensis DSM 19906 = JCM 15041 TaxID=1423766 RepID=A0A0R1NUL6_9LACO|nr:RecQ family ATP-dependent DNA helicase [Lentilactobacillus kisonensis]KRL23369.1 ATP-dependent DNA helicase, RecQ family [Lentilactobacillus kisonensis DSM 19906 = JCM 15041]
MIDLNKELHKHSAFKSFRPGQEEVLLNLFAGQNTLAVLPTGGGKTLLYQLYGAITHQRVLIVSPLISLMQDQVGRLQYLGSKRVVAITSAMDFKERTAILRNLSHYQYIYVSPEMLVNQSVFPFVAQQNIGLFVIDEAHCITEWGPDFRPDYLRLGAVRKQLGNPLTLMMTATATQPTRTDILQRMGFSVGEARQVVMPTNRRNIFLSAKVCANQKEKNDQLESLVSHLDGSGIIYFSSKSQAEQIAAMLTQKTHKRVMAYHGGMDNQQRFRIQQQFMNDDIDIVCATSAFGMGIDKENVRFVIHYHLPNNIQSYVQEIGRCGRDQQPSLAILLYEPNDQYLQLGLIENTIPEEQLLSYLYQHPNELEKNDAFRVIKYYYDTGKSFEEAVSIFDQAKKHRIQELEAIIAYIYTTGCRRKLLLQHFDEVVNNENSEFCCDFHSDFWGHWREFNDHYLKGVKQVKRQRSTDWHQILNNLFLLKN